MHRPICKIQRSISPLIHRSLISSFSISSHPDTSKEKSREPRTQQYGFCSAQKMYRLLMTLREKEKKKRKGKNVGTMAVEREYAKIYCSAIQSCTVDDRGSVWYSRNGRQKMRRRWILMPCASTKTSSRSGSLLDTSSALLLSSNRSHPLHR